MLLLICRDLVFLSSRAGETKIKRQRCCLTDSRIMRRHSIILHETAINLSHIASALCSEGPVFRRSYVQKVLCSEGPLFRRLYVQKVLCSEGSIFRRFYVQKVLCSEIFVQKVLCLESTGDYLSVLIGHTTLVSQKRCLPSGFPRVKLMTLDQFGGLIKFYILQL